MAALALLLSSCRIDPGGWLRGTPPTPTPTWQVGDLGWGDVDGFVIDGGSGQHLAGATVSCTHFSYTSPATCNASTVTDADGYFIFKHIFFHDTDQLNVRAEMPGYEARTVSRVFFMQPGAQFSVDMYQVGQAPVLMCTPPACSDGEVYSCGLDACPGGCGTICATVTPGP